MSVHYGKIVKKKEFDFEIPEFVDKAIDMNNNTKFQWIDNDTDVSEILKKCPNTFIR